MINFDKFEAQINWKYNIEKCWLIKDKETEVKYFEKMKIKPGLELFEYF